MTHSPCILDTARRLDPETDEWVYEVVCENSSHRSQMCPGEHESHREQR